MSAEGQGLDEQSFQELSVNSRMRAEVNHFVDPRSENFGKNLNTEEVQAAAEKENKDLMAGWDGKSPLPGRPYGRLAEEVGASTAEGLGHTDEHSKRVAATEAQRQINSIEEYQKIKKQAENQ